MHGKFLVLLLFASATAAATPVFALGCNERVGGHWGGRIDLPSGIYGFELRRRTCTDDTWNYYIWNTTTRWEGTATVGMTSDTGVVATIDSGELIGCSLSGTWYKRDVHNALPYRASGSASCSGIGTFSATIQ